jgi:predicted DNA-binding ArsR family transcriptional regulator
MSLIQLPKVIELVNSLSFKVSELEKKVQALIDEQNTVTVIEQPLVNKKPTLKKND